MRELGILWMLTLILSGIVSLTGCSSEDEDSLTTNSSHYELLGELMGLTQKKGQNDSKMIVVKLFERSGLKRQVVDITDQFESAIFKDDKKIPVSHVYVEQLPPAIQEKAISAGEDMSTRVCRIEYEGEFYYDIYSVFSSAWINLFNSNGERHDFQSAEDYAVFMNRATNISCILVLISEPVKNAEK